MFREIILNGNQVILTMNQLADSRAFLAAIENENTFEPFFELCQMGVIRISQYGTLRTPSQYFQGKPSLKRVHLFTQGFPLHMMML